MAQASEKWDVMETIIESDKTRLLVEGCRKGERKYQEMLYTTYSSRMFGLCMRYSKSSAEAKDLLQSGFIKVFRKIDTFRHEGSLEGWIRRIMVYNAITNYRKNAKVLRDDISVAENHAAYSVNTDTLEVKDLQKMISHLPDNYRTVFNMHLIEGYSHKEIAELLRVSELASRTNLCRARETLKKMIHGMEIRNSMFMAG